MKKNLFLALLLTILGNAPQGTLYANEIDLVHIIIRDMNYHIGRAVVHLEDVIQYINTIEPSLDPKKRKKMFDSLIVANRCVQVVDLLNENTRLMRFILEENSQSQYKYLSKENTTLFTDTRSLIVPAIKKLNTYEEAMREMTHMNPTSTKDLEDIVIEIKKGKAKLQELVDNLFPPDQREPKSDKTSKKNRSVKK